MSADRPIKSIVKSLGTLSKKWLDPRFSYRKKAVNKLVKDSGFTPAMSEALIEALFSELTEAKLWTLLKSELRNPLFLDGFQRDALNKRQVMVRGPRKIVHIFSGNVPNPAIESMIFGMLLKSNNIAKLSSKDQGFLEVYLDSLKAYDKKLAQANTLISTTDYSALKKAIKQADLVTAYGNDKTLSEIKPLLPRGTQFAGYGHRLSFSIYSKEILKIAQLPAFAKKTAYDIWMMDQRGCLSPSMVLVEKGGEVSPLHFSATLAEQLKVLARKDSKKSSVSFEKAIHNRRVYMDYALSILKENVKTQCWKAADSRWTVFYDEKLTAKPFIGGGQNIVVKGVQNFEAALNAITPFKAYAQAVALECSTATRDQRAKKLATFGFNRICRAGKLQRPPSTWHHDGKPNFSSWLYWIDLENE